MGWVNKWAGVCLVKKNKGGGGVDRRSLLHKCRVFRSVSVVSMGEQRASLSGIGCAECSIMGSDTE